MTCGLSCSYPTAIRPADSVICERGKDVRFWQKCCLLAVAVGTLLAVAPAVEAQSVAAEQGYKRARTMASNARWDDALATLNEVLKKAPNYPDALYLAGVCHLSKGEYPQAEKRLKRLTELNKEFINGWGMLANVYLATKQLDKIKDIVVALGKVKGGKAEAYYFSGVVAYLKTDLDQAIRDWRNAVRAVPDMAKAHYNIGIAMYAKGDKARAMQGLRDATRYDPENPLYRYSLADLQLETGNKIEGMKNLDRVRQQTFRKDISYLASARQMWHNGHYEQAEKLAAQAIAANKDLNEAFLLRGQALDKLGRTEEALTCYRKALEDDPNYVVAKEAISRLAPPAPQLPPEPEASLAPAAESNAAPAEAPDAQPAEAPAASSAVEPTSTPAEAPAGATVP